MRALNNSYLWFASSENQNIARIANAVHCHSWFSGNNDCHEFRFSILHHHCNQCVNCQKTILQTCDNWDTDSHPLPEEMNISQLQGKIEFNTFLFCKPYNWCIKLLNIILVVLLVGWWVLLVILVILVIFGDFGWFWVIFWWFLMDFSTYLAISTSYF